MAEKIAKSVPKPVTFVNSDPKQSARTFIDKYDVYKKLLNWDDTIAARSFGMFLGEQASTWLKTLPQETLDNYKILRE